MFLSLRWAMFAAWAATFPYPQSDQLKIWVNLVEFDSQYKATNLPPPKEFLSLVNNLAFSCFLPPLCAVNGSANHSMVSLNCPSTEAKILNGEGEVTENLSMPLTWERGAPLSPWCLTVTVRVWACSLTFQHPLNVFSGNSKSYVALEGLHLLTCLLPMSL